jgi:hypothetical protein
MSWLALLLFGAFGGLACFCFLRSYRYLRPGTDAVRRRLILRGPLTRQDLFTTEGWVLRLRGWLFAGLALLVLLVWGLWERHGR